MSELAESAARRAAALLDLGRPHDAEQLARKALGSEPKDATLLTVLARALLDQKRYADARDMAARSLALDPENVTGLSCVAAAAAGQLRHADALAAVSRAVELAPTHAGLHRQHAEILLATGRPDEALDAAQQARQLAPHSATIAAALGEILMTKGQLEPARVEIARALALDPENARAHRAAGRLELHRGGATESIQRYREALRLDPADAGARRGLATALKARNPIYRTLLTFQIWLATLPNTRRWATVFGPLVLVRIINASLHGPIAATVSTLFLIFIAISWGADPICNLILLSNRADRILLTTGQRRATLAFAGFAALAVGCFTGAFRSRWLIPYGFGFTLWAFISGAAYGPQRPALRKALVIIELGAITAGVVGLTCLGLGVHNGSVAASAILLISALPTWWIVALAR